VERLWGDYVSALGLACVSKSLLVQRSPGTSSPPRFKLGQLRQHLFGVLNLRAGVFRVFFEVPRLKSLRERLHGVGKAQRLFEIGAVTRSLEAD
jgi:hypothetical protein